MEPYQRILQYIVCLLPPPQIRIAVEHFPSEPQQSFTGVSEQRVTYCSIPL